MVELLRDFCVNNPVCERHWEMGKEKDNHGDKDKLDHVINAKFCILDLNVFGQLHKMYKQYKVSVVCLLDKTKQDPLLFLRNDQYKEKNNL